jgi:hypothetical protein
MSESFRERVRRMERLLNKMDEYERNHADEWCPISDQILKDMYPEECSSQAGRDKKAETMSNEEFEMVFDATLQQYRKARKKNQKKQTADQSEHQQDVEVVEVQHQ